jgi:hypothetical protein
MVFVRKFIRIYFVITTTKRNRTNPIKKKPPMTVTARAHNGKA